MNFNLFGDPSDTESEDSVKIKQNELLPWIEKYRPDTLDGLISHTHIINSLKTFKKKKNMQHILFYGPAGTGKTSTILAFAKELYGDNFNFMVMELNASDDRGIETVRNKIKQFVASDNMFCRFTPGNKVDKRLFKLVILDEIDAMTSEAQSILRNVVENYTKHARFCLICNYLRKITPALQSRCIPFKFSPLKISEMKLKLNVLIEEEEIDITTTGINTLLIRSKGDMRKAINMLQTVNMIYTTIDSNKINNCFGFPQTKDIKSILKSLINDDFLTSYTLINKISKSFGLSLDDIINDIYKIIFNAIVNKKYKIKDMKNVSFEYCVNILNLLRLIELNNTTNITNDIQIAGIISIFKLGKNIDKLNNNYIKSLI